MWTARATLGNYPDLFPNPDPSVASPGACENFKNPMIFTADSVFFAAPNPNHRAQMESPELAGCVGDGDLLPKTLSPICAEVYSLCVLLPQILTDSNRNSRNPQIVDCDIMKSKVPKVL
ncbi:hypothetical protein U1Q18_033654 [Sarracenia purpurea var. burkii]